MRNEVSYGSCLFCDGKEYAKYKIYCETQWFGLGEECLKKKEYTKKEWRKFKQNNRQYIIEGEYGLLDENEME